MTLINRHRRLTPLNSIEDGKVCETELEEFNLRLYDRTEFRSLLKDAGFCEIRCLKPYSGEPAGDSEECAVFECRKMPER